MSNYTLSNGTLTIEAACHGAELQSLRRNGREYLWQPFAGAFPDGGPRVGR